MGLFAISKLADALSELIGCEEALADKAAPGGGLVEVPAGWAGNRASLADFKKRGWLVYDSIKEDFTNTFMVSSCLIRCVELRGRAAHLLSPSTLSLAV